MAEGHAVLYWARHLRALVGEPVVEVQVPRRWQVRARALLGSEIVDVSTRGKHLLIRFSGGTTVHCHALMFGSWQFGQPGMLLEKPKARVRLLLRTATREAVFFNGPVVELLSADELATHSKLKALGPDLLSPAFDRAETWRRLSCAPDREVGDALLDQTIVAGIGNIYKSEGLFLVGVDPRRPVGSLSRERVESLWDTLVPLMSEAAERDGRATTLPPELLTPGRRHWVYRCTGRPCLRCDTRVASVRQGSLGRRSYYCPRCQG